MPPCAVSATTRASHDVRYESSRNRQSVGMSGFYKRRRDAALALEPGRHRQFLRAQKLRIEQLRLIARAAVGEDGDDGVAGAEVLGEADGAGDVDAGRAAEAEPFVLQHLEDQRQRLLVGNEIGPVNLETLDDRRDAAEADAFGNRAALACLGLAGLEQIIHRGAARIGAADDDVLLLVAQIAGDAGKRATGANRADEAVDLAAGLLPDLRPGRDVMRLAVV